MKEIDLPVTTTYSITVDTHNMSDMPIEDIAGKKMVSLGTIDIGEKSNDIIIARNNGGKILYATTSIEQKLERIISHYIFGLFLGPHPERSFFENEILGSSNIGFNFKKELVKKLINSEKLLEGKNKHKLERKLADIMMWRNAFAHGKLQYDNVQGCFLKYYSNGHKQMMLDDQFWDVTVQTFEESDKILDQIFNYIEKTHLDNNKYTG